MTAKEQPIAQRVLAAIAKADGFMTLDEICQAVFGATGTRERSAVSVAIHRLGREVEKRPAGFRRRR